MTLRALVLCCLCGLLAAADAAPITNLAGAPRRPILLPDDGSQLELTVKELGDFAFDQNAGGELPPDILALEGQRISLVGYMVPQGEANEVRRFILTGHSGYDPCCFTTAPVLQQMVQVDCPKDSVLQFLRAPVIVEGVLHVKVEENDGYIISVFRMKLESLAVK